MDRYEFLSAIVEFGDMIQNDYDCITDRDPRRQLLRNLLEDFKEIYENAEKALDKMLKE